MASHAKEEQLLYAKVLNAGMAFGLLSTIAAFLVYISGLMPPKISFDDLQRYWKMPVNQYLKASGMHTGWSWLHDIGCGDMLNLLPIAFLSGLTIVCYLAIIPSLRRQKDTAYVVIAVVEVLVLILAASGILRAGGH